MQYQNDTLIEQKINLVRQRLKAMIEEKFIYENYFIPIQLRLLISQCDESNMLGAHNWNLQKTQKNVKNSNANNYAKLVQTEAVEKLDKYLNAGNECYETMNNTPNSNIHTKTQLELLLQRIKIDWKLLLDLANDIVQTHDLKPNEKPPIYNLSSFNENE